MRKSMNMLVLLMTITMIATFALAGIIVAADENTMPAGKVVTVAACVDNTAVLMEDGSVWAWGDNSCRQLGGSVDSAQKFVFEPVKISGLKDIVDIAAGNGFILALDVQGRVWGVGNNISNVIRPSRDTQIISNPLIIPGLSNISSIAADTNYAAAIKSDGTVWLWGEFRYRLENSSKVIEAKRIQNARKIYTLRYNTVVVDDNGIGWISRGRYLKPMQITQVSDIIDIVEGVNNTYSVRADGSVWSWSTSSSETIQLEGLKGVKKIVGVKDDDLIILDQEGFIWSWDSKSKKAVRNDNLSDIVSIAAGKSHFAALKKDNTIWSWGANKLGQLGNGGAFFIVKPIQVEGLDDVKQVSAAKDFTAAVKNDGTLWMWGSNSSGQLGNGTRENSYTPVQVKGISDVEKVAAGISHVLALKKDGTVWAWGSNICGELGDGTYISKQEPTQVPGLIAKDIAAGNGFSIAIRKYGNVVVWGNSGYGEEDDPVYKDRSVPVVIKDFNSAKMIAAGYDHGIALKADQSVWAWGSNGYGQFGFSLSEKALKKKNAVRVPGTLEIMQVSAGYSHNLALSRNGTVIGWGSNDYGQLGISRDDKNYNNFTRQAIKGFENVKEVIAGNNSSFAIKTDGVLWAWGDNSMGQLGTNDTISTNSPIQVPDMADIKNVSAGQSHSAAVRKDGTVWVWGSNIYGQLGTGKASKDYESLPVKSLVNKK